MLDITLEHKKIWVLGLLYQCPVGKEKEECKLNDMRELSDKERENIIFEMSDKELDEFIHDHKCCIKVRGY